MSSKTVLCAVVLLQLLHILNAKAVDGTATAQRQAVHTLAEQANCTTDYLPTCILRCIPQKLQQKSVYYCVAANNPLKEPIAKYVNCMNELNHPECTTFDVAIPSGATRNTRDTDGLTAGKIDPATLRTMVEKLPAADLAALRTATANLAAAKPQNVPVSGSAAVSTNSEPAVQLSSSGSAAGQANLIALLGGNERAAAALLAANGPIQCVMECLLDGKNQCERDLGCSAPTQEHLTARAQCASRPLADANAVASLRGLLGCFF